MRIILSPAKKMRVDEDSFAPKALPVFTDRAEILMHALQMLSFAEAKALWVTNDNLTRLNMTRLQNMDLRAHLTPAILSYEGIQYQYMAPEVLTAGALDYIEEHLRILSGFYGIVKPFDGVTPYRLEMQAKLSVDGHKDLYAFWGRSLFDELTAGGHHLILNLASKEYAKAVEPYLTGADRFLTVVFGEEQNGKVVQKGTLAKMARGDMVRFLSENAITDPEAIKEYAGLGYAFREDLSDAATLTFLKQ